VAALASDEPWTWFTESTLKDWRVEEDGFLSMETQAVCPIRTLNNMILHALLKKGIIEAFVNVTDQFQISEVHIFAWRLTDTMKNGYM